MWWNYWRRIKNFFVLLGSTSVRLWLDDLRPAPNGWYHAANAEEAIDILTCFMVTDCSLDHDLGECNTCAKDIGCDKDCRCECHKTGYDVVCFMEEYNAWPHKKPTVHSMNAIGRTRMQLVIDKKYNKGGRRGN